jgi:hypothetical protein
MTKLWDVDSSCPPFHLMNNEYYFLFLKMLLSLFMNWHWSFLVGLCAC